MAKKTETYIKQTDPSLNKRFAVKGKVYNYLVNKELGNLIFEGNLGDITIAADGQISCIPRIISHKNIFDILASLWIQYKLKALAGFNPLDDSIQISVIRKAKKKGDDMEEYIVSIFNRKE
jgi:hypothetical protein